MRCIICQFNSIQNDLFPVLELKLILHNSQSNFERTAGGPCVHDNEERCAAGSHFLSPSSDILLLALV